MPERKVPARLLITIAAIGAAAGVAALTIILVWYSSTNVQQQLPTWEGYFAAVERMVSSQGQLESAVFEAYFGRRAGGDQELKKSVTVSNAIEVLEANWQFLESTPGAINALTKGSAKTTLDLAEIRRIAGGLEEGYSGSIEKGDGEFLRWIGELRLMGGKLNSLMVRAREVEIEQRDVYVEGVSRARERLLYGIALLMVGGVCILVAAMGWWWLKVQQLRNVKEAVRLRGVAADAVIEAASAAEERERLRKSLLGVVAHELRTPLQAIASAADMIELYQRDVAPPQMAEALRGVSDRVKVSVEQMKVQLMDLRAMARSKGPGPENSGQGSGLMRPEAFNPETWFESVKLAAEGISKYKGVELKYACDTSSLGGAKLYADQNRLIQIANNLISNALKYTNKGEVVVSFVAIKGNLETHGGKDVADVSFYVKDSGSGIDKDDLPRVTERYFRGRNSLGKQSTGLGLEIVKRLVERMQGNLRIESTLRVGTKVMVSLVLPLVVDAVKPSVLIMDEERAADHAEIMTKLGWATYTARNKAECIYLAESEEFDLVLMDCNADGDGARLAAEVKELAERKGRDVRIFGIEGSEYDGPPVSDPVYDSVLVEPLQMGQLKLILRDESRAVPEEGKYVEKRRRRGRGRKGGQK